MTRTIRQALGGVAAAAIIASCAQFQDAIATSTPAVSAEVPAAVETASVLPDEAPAWSPIPAGQLPEGVTPTAYRIDLRTDPEQATYTGIVSIDVTLDAPTREIYLHALGPEIGTALAVYEGDIALPAEFEGDLADGGVSRLTFPSDLPAGDATLTLTYEAPFNLGLAGLYKAEQADRAYLATQMEPIDARRAFPSFDEPRFKTPWTMTVTAPAGNTVITNGAEKSQTTLDDGWVRHEFETTRPIQSYLVALAVGPYDVFETEAIAANDIRAEAVPFRSFAPSGKADSLETAHESTFRLLDIQEEYFNYPYPYGKLDLIAVPDFAYGAMENAGAIVYRESALLIDERTSLARRRGVLTTHAHELAHQWFGNLVTPKWWDDIWLNEAFATWMSYKTMHAYDPDGGFDRQPTARGIGAMGADSLASARQIRNPIEANGDILSAFDGITYSKGGHVLSMFENYLGADQFREGIRLHMTRFEDGVADVNDFMSSLADGSGNPAVVDSFKSFIFQPGIPFLNVELACPAAGAGNVTVTQTRYAPLGSNIDTDAKWQVPFAMIVARNGETETLTQLLTDKTTEIALDGECPDYVMPNAGGAGYWRFTTGDDNWSALAENFDSLDGGEQMIFADSLVAAFRAGEVSAAAMLTGLAATPSGEWDAASIPLGRLAGLLSVLDEEDQPAMRTWLADTYANQWEYLNSRTSAGLSEGDVLLRERIYNMLVSVAEDQDLREEIKVRAASFVGLDGEPDPSAVPAAELRTAIAVGVESLGSDFFAAALKVAEGSQNQGERRNIFNTLAATGSEADVLALLEAANGDGFQGQEALFMYYSAIRNANAQDAAWEAFKSNFDALLPRVPEIRKPQMAGVAGAFCTAEQTDAAEDFILSKADQIPGYERPLAQAVEGARLCAALKEAKAGELADALK